MGTFGFFHFVRSSFVSIVKKYWFFSFSKGSFIYCIFRAFSHQRLFYFFWKFFSFSKKTVFFLTISNRSFWGFFRSFFKNNGFSFLETIQVGCPSFLIWTKPCFTKKNDVHLYLQPEMPELKPWRKIQDCIQGVPHHIGSCSCIKF